MANSIDVYLITGFLGSGKTTFLNKLFKQFPKELKLMILMNEFGEIGVDGTLVESTELDILEISKGSIFCACVKTDFIKGLYEIAHKIKPDVLIIESTGVANPSDLKKDLVLPIFNNAFIFREQFCLIDAAHFLDEFGVFASVERQIATSSRFIINKTDLATTEQIEEIKSLVRQHHPNPLFYEAIFAGLDFAELLALEKELGPETLNNQTIISPEELDSFVEELLGNPQSVLLPPDILMSATFKWQEDSLDAIVEFTRRLPRGVVRAKGFIVLGTQGYLYNYIMGQYDLDIYNVPVKPQQRNVLVFIFPPSIMKQLDEIAMEFNLIKLGELTPGSSF